MTIRVAINGFGRIGRNVLRAHYESERDGEERLANMAEILNAADGYLKAEKIDEAAPSYDLYHEDAPSPIEGFLTQATLEAGDKNEGGCA